MIARDLYRLRKEVERLKEEIKLAKGDKKEEKVDLLRKARAELNRMQGILDGSKEPPKIRRPL
jgi:hypothetical protein